MTTRYWAPTRPHLEPDPVDLALLAPSGTDRLDLGAALLAMHRVGAAACQVAARTPLVDGNTLINSVATARQGLADPMINSVSKSVGSETYAALLVRDLFNDAESGALDLFRHAVAKGVAPPVAAERAGAVFGVPSSALGRFRNLAADPRANPAVLADTADRTLLSYVEKVVTEEAREEVSKQPTMDRAAAVAVDPDDPRTPYYDARDARGRFARGEGAVSRGAPQTESGGADVRVLERPQAVTEAVAEPPRPMSAAVARLRAQLGVGRQRAPEQVGTTPAEAEATAEQERVAQAEQERQQRIARARGARQKRGQRIRQRQAQQAATPATTRAVTRGVTRRPIQTRVFSSVRRKEEATSTAPMNSALLERFPKSDIPYNRADVNFNFAMARDSRVNRFVNLWNNGPGRLFRVGHLQNLAGEPEPITLPGAEEEESADSYSLARNSAQQHEKDSAVEVQRLDYTPKTMVDFDEKLRQAKIEFARNQGITLEQITDAPSRDGTGWYLIDNSSNTAMPEVIEWHVLGPRSLVVKKGQWQLDPNQAFRALSIDEAQERGLETYFISPEDEQTTDANAKGILHMINYMVPVDEAAVELAMEAARRRDSRRGQAGTDDVEKQVTTLEREELRRRAQVQPRDRIGRFAEIQSPGVARYTSQLSKPRSAEPAPAEEATDQDQLAAERTSRIDRARVARQRRVQRRTGTRTQPEAKPKTRRNVLRQVNREGLRRAADYRRLSGSLSFGPQDEPPYQGEGGGEPPKPENKFDLMPDGAYKAVSIDDFARYANLGQEGDEQLLQGNPPDVIYIHDKGDIQDLLDETYTTLGEEPTKRSMRVTYAAQQLEDDEMSPEPIHSWASTDLNAQLDAAKRAHYQIRENNGLLLTEPEDPAGLRMRHLFSSFRVRPIVLIDFSDERVSGEQPFELVFDGDQEYEAQTDDLDIAEIGELADVTPGTTMLMRFPVWKYVAQPLEPGEYDNSP